MKKVLYLLLVLLSTLLLLACTHSHKQNGDLLKVPEPVRLDTMLMLPDGVDAMLEQASGFCEYWAKVLGNDGREPMGQLFRRFAADTLIQQLSDSIHAVYPETSALRSDLRQAFARLAEELPELPIPQIYLYNSGFNASLLLVDSMLGIGLDRFLGAHSPYYEWLGIPRYLARQMTPRRLVPTAVEGWVESEYPIDPTQTNMLDNMLYRGKLLYIARHALPNAPDSVALGYTEEQINWLTHNERAIWLYLSEKKLLFERNALLISQFTRPAPFTTALGQDSPGQAACWVGYRIVSRFMERHPKTSWQELLVELQSQQIMEGARYNP